MLKTYSKEQKAKFSESGKFLIDSDFNENTSSSDDLGDEVKKVIKFERDPDLFVMDVDDLMLGKCNFSD